MKSNLLTSNDFMHNVKDYVLPIIVLIIIIALLIFFKQTCIKSAIQNLGGNKTSESRSNIEHFDSSEGVKVDLRTLSTKIHGNLFSGFESRKESDKQLDNVKDIIAKNPEKYKMISPYRNNIFINGSGSNTLNKICLGNVEDNCINYDLMKKYDPATNPIPIFVKGTSEDPVYYNHDDTVVKHDKLCIRDDEKGDNLISDNLYSCIEDKHLNIINGSIAIAFKKQPPDVTSVNDGCISNKLDNCLSQQSYDTHDGCMKSNKLKDRGTECCPDTDGKIMYSCPNANWNCGPRKSDLALELYTRSHYRGDVTKIYNWEFNDNNSYTFTKKKTVGSYKIIDNKWTYKYNDDLSYPNHPDINYKFEKDDSITRINCNPTVTKEVDNRKSQTTADGKEGCLPERVQLKDKYHATWGCKDDTTGRLDLKCPFPANWNCGPSESDLSIILYGRTKRRGKEIKVYNWQFNDGIFQCPKSCDRIRSYIIMETGVVFDVENTPGSNKWSKLESSMDDTTSNKDYAKRFRNDFRLRRRCKSNDDAKSANTDTDDAFCAEVPAEEGGDCKAEGDDEIIKSYNVEYGPFKGFVNVATKTFYMTEKNYNEINCKFNTPSFDQAAPGCFSSDQGGRTKHTIEEPRGEAFTYSGNYYINQQTPDISNYKHIHKHDDS